MQVHILASGSTGNAIFLHLADRNILIDAGISARRIEQGLAGIGVKVSDLNCVLITHEHSDHIKGLDVLIRRHELPVYARPQTWEHIPCRAKLPPQCCRDLNEGINLGPVRVEPFPVSHDAADPVGFCFFWRRLKWVVATDLGMVTPAVENAFADARVAVVESNHDPAMLQNGPYPRYLKERIKGEKGHLANIDAAHLLANACGHRPMDVFLAHLSQQNNTPALAEHTVAQCLTEQGYDVGREVILHRTYPDRRVSCAINLNGNYSLPGRNGQGSMCSGI